jgi:hypothetical protein
MVRRGKPSQPPHMDALPLQIVKCRELGDETYSWIDWSEENPPAGTPPAFWVIYSGEFPSEDEPEVALMMPVSRVRAYLPDYFNRHWKDDDAAFFESKADAETVLACLKASTPDQK